MRQGAGWEKDHKAGGTGQNLTDCTLLDIERRHSAEWASKAQKPPWKRKLFFTVLPHRTFARRGTHAWLQTRWSRLRRSLPVIRHAIIVLLHGCWRRQRYTLGLKAAVMPTGWCTWWIIQPEECGWSRRVNGQDLDRVTESSGDYFMLDLSRAPCLGLCPELNRLQSWAGCRWFVTHLRVRHAAEKSRVGLLSTAQRIRLDWELYWFRRNETNKRPCCQTAAERLLSAGKAPCFILRLEGFKLTVFGWGMLIDQNVNFLIYDSILLLPI